jgi:H+/Cl- antiporter ClcA
MVKQNLIRLSQDVMTWLLLGTVIGVPIGLASALFLYSLDFVSHWRESNLWIIVFLPLVGLLIGYIYSNLGKSSESGTNLILQEYFIPSKTLPKLMAPLILVSTLLTHLVGASAGREGTAIQMGAAIADRFHFLGEKFQQNRALFLTAGIGAGFASLFGTPWAGAIFAIELLRNKSIPWSGVIPALTTSFVAYFTCLLTKAPHTHYKAVEGLQFDSTTLIYLFAVSALFGMVALLYVYAHQFFKSLGVVLVRSNIWRPFFGGIVIFIIFAIMGNTRFMGLGIPSILDSFENHAAYYDFLVKLLLTAFTLAFGFKGGEVTPLFFIGATLGSALSMVVPIPIALMAAVGFLAVFAGATKTFLACSIMGGELFGWEAFPYFFASCLVAQIFSGTKGIYENINKPISLFISKP